MENLNFVQLDERVYKYIRQFTIKDSNAALIELITNCNDAYKYGNIQNKPIFIEYRSPNILRVYDNAIGLTSQSLNECFLQVGKYTNNLGSRGFFSRGSKDISAIGNIYFDTIKDGKYSQCYLNSNAYGKLCIADSDVTPEIREKFGIPCNGLSVTIELLENFIVTDPSDQAESISKTATLRDIIMDQNIRLYYTHLSQNNTIMFSRQLSFVYPESTLLLDMTYCVPNYTDASVRFVVYKTTDGMLQPKRESEMMFGFLIKDSTTVYEISTIDTRFRWNPYMNYIYGYLECEYINKLLIDFDVNGASASNPLPIIDPSRLTGLNKDHPFIISMLSLPKVRLDRILIDLNKEISAQSISLKEMDQIFDELSKYGLNILEKENVQMTFTPTYDSKLAKAIESDRAKFVTSEINHSFAQTNREIDPRLHPDLIKKFRSDNPNASAFIMDEQNNLVSIDNCDPNDFAPAKIVRLIRPEYLPAFAKQPYVYRLNDDGTVQKIYIFQKSTMEQHINPENLHINAKTKKFQIMFVNDINLKSRYVIEYSDGVNVKFNIANEIVKKYLKITNTTDDLSVENINSTNSLTFLENLITDVFSDIILENDITNNRLILDGDNFTNNRKVTNRWDSIHSDLELPIHNIFSKFKCVSVAKKQDLVIDNILNIFSTQTSPDILTKFYELKDSLVNTLMSTIE